MNKKVFSPKEEIKIAIILFFWPVLATLTFFFLRNYWGGLLGGMLWTISLLSLAGFIESRKYISHSIVMNVEGTSND